MNSKEIFDLHQVQMMTRATNGRIFVRFFDRYKGRVLLDIPFNQEKLFIDETNSTVEVEHEF